MAFSWDEVTGTLLSFKSASSSADYSLTFILTKTHEKVGTSVSPLVL
jgi:hypothetical protein